MFGPAARLINDSGRKKEWDGGKGNFRFLSTSRQTLEISSFPSGRAGCRPRLLGRQMPDVHSSTRKSGSWFPGAFAFNTRPSTHNRCLYFFLNNNLWAKMGVRCTFWRRCNQKFFFPTFSRGFLTESQILQRGGCHISMIGSSLIVECTIC